MVMAYVILSVVMMIASILIFCLSNDIPVKGGAGRAGFMGDERQTLIRQKAILSSWSAMMLCGVIKYVYSLPIMQATHTKYFFSDILSDINFEKGLDVIVMGAIAYVISYQLWKRKLS
ncbi:hypothetical protein [Baia soyae]|uniref:Uncharacterized protein n=1 Tax=Baia soyae TaxID=1544746 RepID=A0A4R2S820_9BACL|nr:hypothetical protein [Baia soyae]TCP68551.1 hypothetical protein EDD57_11612 [Baia soyae]